MISLIIGTSGLAIDPPGIINHQGRIAVEGVNYDGVGFFKLAIQDSVGNNIWTNDGTRIGSDSEPDTSIEVAVSRGHYGIALGDTTFHANMNNEIAKTLFTENQYVQLSIWFSEDNTTFARLLPNRRIASTGYALTAGAVAGDGVTLSEGNLSFPATTSDTGIIYSGSNTLMHVYGTSNFFAGLKSGNLTMTGAANTGCGTLALNLNSSGNNNTACGHFALEKNSTGSSNTAVGNTALRFTTTGHSNTASGGFSLLKNTTGNRNTASGFSSLLENTTGDNNVAIGYLAGQNLTTGDHNIMIANEGNALESNTIRIGNSIQQRTFIAGIRGRTTGVADAIGVYIDSAGQLGTVSSSRRYKEDIQTMSKTNVGEKIDRLRPVTFRYKTPYDDGKKPIQFGLIAEEVAEVFPELTVLDESGEPETVKYHLLTPILLNEVQKLRSENGDLRQRLERLEAAINGNTGTSPQEVE